MVRRPCGYPVNAMIFIRDRNHHNDNLECDNNMKSVEYICTCISHGNYVKPYLTSS